MINKKQKYISDTLYHFVGSKNKDDRATQFEILCQIIDQKLVSNGQPDPNNSRIMIRYNESLDRMFTAGITCFADIPMSELKIHTEKYGMFGLGFKKEFLAKKGANPVFYIAKGCHLKHKNSKFEEYIVKNVRELKIQMLTLMT